MSKASLGKMQFDVVSVRLSAHASQAHCKQATITLDTVRQDVPPCMESITYEIIVDTDESERRLDLLHDNVKKFGTVFNTVAPGTELAGVLHRKIEPS